MQSGLHDPPRGGRMSVELRSGTNRPALQVPAAVRALTTQAHLDTPRAPGALEGADHGIGRSGWQVDVAAFAVRPQLQHAASVTAFAERHPPMGIIGAARRGETWPAPHVPR
ncbi:hypothetical protein GCM10027053_32390 [Intrasporangium mesophilum]